MLGGISLKYNISKVQKPISYKILPGPNFTILSQSLLPYIKFFTIFANHILTWYYINAICVLENHHNIPVRLHTQPSERDA